jgi:hypothetical protein
MHWITDTARIVCSHQTGSVALAASQHWVQAEGGHVLVLGDLEGCAIAGCSNYGVNVKPCTSTLVTSAGISAFITIDGVPVLRDDATGYTDGTAPSAVTYLVNDAGQQLVDET